MSSQVTIYSLEMNDPSELLESTKPDNIQIVECCIKQFPLNRFMYLWVGENWQWNDRKSWSVKQWQDYAEADNLRTWVAYYQGSPAGYFELQQQENAVEIAYFGLLPNFIGRGLGGYLLSQAISQAWQWGTRRVWVHTCSLDHPSALSNYQARGLQLYNTETKTDNDNEKIVKAEGACHGSCDFAQERHP